VSQDTITVVAAAALVDGDARFAVDALEQDRLRLLTGLRDMVEDSRG
jgi:hypothetical protein